MSYVLPKAGHGSRSAYNWGCRCDACRAANTRYYHERQARRDHRSMALRMADREVAQRCAWDLLIVECGALRVSWRGDTQDSVIGYHDDQSVGGASGSAQSEAP